MPRARVEIINRTRHSVPRAAFSAAACAVLPGYDISLAFVTPKEAHALNEHLRGKRYTPNVLSYRVAEGSGEIIICPSEARKQSRSHGMSADQFLAALFIHGLLHIKGWRHGVTMEKCEQKLLARFAPMGARDMRHDAAHSHRY